MAKKNPCIQKVADAFGITKDREDLLEVIRKQVLEAEKFKNSPDRLAELGKLRKLNKEQIESVAYLKAKDIEVGATLQGFIDDPKLNKAKDWNAYFRATATSLDYIKEGGKLSLENIRQVEATRAAKFFDQALGDNVKHLFDPDQADDILIGLGMLRKGKDISNLPAHLQRTIEGLNKIMRWIPKTLRDAGIFIKERDDYLIRQTHDRTKIVEYINSNGGKNDAWIDAIHPLLDKQQTFGDVVDATEQRKILENILNDIVSGEYGSPVGMLKGKRKLHFLGPDQFAQYHKMFSEGDIGTTVLKMLNATANVKSMFRRYGPNPEKAWNNAEKKIGEHIRKTQGQEEYQKFMDESFQLGQKWNRDALKQQVFRDHSDPIKHKVTKVLEGIKTVNFMSLLGQAYTMTLPDFASGWANLMSKFGMGYFESGLEILKAAARNLSPAHRKQVGDMVLTNLNTNAGMHKYADLDDGVTGIIGHTKSWGRKVLKVATHMTGLPFTTAWFRSMGVDAALAKMGNDLKLKFSELDPRLQAEMKNFNLSEKDWEILKLTVNEDLGYAIPAIERLEDLDLKHFNSAQHRENVLVKWASLMTHQANKSSPQTSMQTRVRLKGKTKVGTPERAFVDIMTQFLSYGMEIPRNLREAVLSNPDVDATTLVGGLKHPGNAYILGTYMMNGLALASLGLWAKDLSSGKTLRDVDQKFIMQALTNSVMPMHLELMLRTGKGDFTKEDFLTGIMGPGIDDINDLAALLSTPFAADKKGKQWEKFVKRANKIIKSNLPLRNNPIAAMGYHAIGVNALLNTMDKNAVRRYERSLRKNNQSQWNPFVIPY
jgi:hypothetical protein